MITGSVLHHYYKFWPMMGAHTKTYVPQPPVFSSGKPKQGVENGKTAATARQAVLTGSAGVDM